MSDREDMRERLISEATNLFATRGFSGSSVREIVEAVGTTKPTLYYHFGNKQGLYLAAIESHFSKWFEHVRGVSASGGTVVERLATLIQDSLDLVRTDANVMGFMIRVRMEQLDTDKGVPSIDLKEPHERYMQILVPLMAEGIQQNELVDCDPQDAAFAYMGMLNCYLMSELDGACAVTGVADRILRFLVKGDAQ